MNAFSTARRVAIDLELRRVHARLDSARKREDPEAEAVARLELDSLLDQRLAVDNPPAALTG